MRLRIEAAVLASLLAAIGIAGEPVALRGAATEVWPAQVVPAADEAALRQRVANLDAAAATLPPELLPAIRFEQAFVRIIARASESDWLPGVRTMADASGTDPVTAAVREVAKAWVARVEMRGIGAVLDQHYVKNVRYPNFLSEVERDLPKDLRMDPWGETWAYRTHAPAGFAREVSQRYTLGPRRDPDLGTLEEATVHRKPLTPPAWKIALRQFAGNDALEFSLNNAVVGVLQAGGKLDLYTLVYVGDRWALMAATDQLFTVTF